MIKPDCTDCVTNSPSDGEDEPPNLGVVLGVLGGMALVGMFVLIAVPLTRHRKRRKGRFTVREDLESSFFGSRRSSFRHQKMQHTQMPPGPDVFLPLIDRVSNITWSDLRSKNSSTDSMNEVEYSFRTDNAATSHNALQTPGVDEMEHDIVDAQLSPSGSKPTPPGLPYTIGASTATGGAIHSSLPAVGTVHPTASSMFPLSPVSPVFASGRARSGSRPRAATSKPGMEPLMEDSDHHPQPRQLPSPPSSPDQSQPHWPGSSSRRRPNVTGTHSSPSSLPFRPRSSTGPSVPLTAAFQTSVLHSGTQPSHASSHTQGHLPAVSSPHHESRLRAGTVSHEGAPDVQRGEARPVDAFRRMSTTDIRQRYPSSITDRRASLRPAESTHAAEYQEAGPSRQKQEAYSHAPLSTTARSGMLSPPSAYPVTSRSSARPFSVDAISNPAIANWRHPQHSQAHQQQPVLVKRKDSLALRPLPISPFAPPVPSKSPSIAPSSSSTRSRSHSVMSERSLPRHLPPLNPLPPLQFDNEFLPPEGDKRSDRSHMKSR